MTLVAPDLLRVMLLVGLIAHKLLWEVLKRSHGAPAAPSRSRHGSTVAVKLVKMFVLAFLVVQTVALDVLPMTPNADGLRAFGLILFMAGLVVAMAARFQLGRNWSDLEDCRLVPGQALVAKGIYRYVRHPIYAGDVLMLVGLELALNSWLVLGALVAAVVVVRQARAEEVLLKRTLPGYQEYCARTKRFIPLIV